MATIGLVLTVGGLMAVERPVAPGVEWARVAEVPQQAAETTLPGSDVLGQGFWEGDMLFTPQGRPASAFAAMGRDPVRASNYEPTAGILYLAMDGVTLSPHCNSGDTANAARNCTPLVDHEVAFPAFGPSSSRAAAFQTLSGYYEDFNLVITTNRPPAYVPYTMAVIGGSAGLAGQGGGVCGIANVACDGLKRNHVSLSFPESCNSIAAIAAQETSHNWGLEHVDLQADIMYPFVTGGAKRYDNACNTIDHSTGSGSTQCGYVHRVYCPEANGEEQNSYAELMAAFGPREVDDVAPVITSITPEDGARISNLENIVISATVDEDSTFLGARWTWLEGLPPELDEYSRCTNSACDEDYNFGVSIDSSAAVWNFVTLQQAPAGTYSFRFEVMDAYGNSDTRTITFEVVGDAPGGTGGVEGTSGAGDTEAPTSVSGGGSEGSGEAGATSVGDGTGGTEQGETGSGAEEGGAAQSETAAGCGCLWPAAPAPSWWLVVLVPLACRRGRKQVTASRRPR